MHKKLGISIIILFLLLGSVIAAIEYIDFSFPWSIHLAYSEQTFDPATQTWSPPKKVFEVNGQVLPVPSNSRQGKERGGDNSMKCSLSIIVKAFDFNMNSTSIYYTADRNGDGFISPDERNIIIDSCDRAGSRVHDEQTSRTSVAHLYGRIPKNTIGLKIQIIDSAGNVWSDEVEGEVR